MLGSLEPSDGWDQVSNKYDAISGTTLSNSELLNPTDHCSEQAAVVHSMPAEQRVHQARCSCLSAFQAGEVCAAMLSCMLGCQLEHAAPGRMAPTAGGFISCVIAVSWRPHKRGCCRQTSCLLAWMCPGVHTASGSTSRAGTQCNRFVLCTLHQAARPGQALSATTLCCAILAQTSLQLL